MAEKKEKKILVLRVECILLTGRSCQMVTVYRVIDLVPYISVFVLACEVREIQAGRLVKLAGLMQGRLIA